MTLFAQSIAARLSVMTFRAPSILARQLLISSGLKFRRQDWRLIWDIVLLINDVSLRRWSCVINKGSEGGCRAYHVI